MTDGLREFLIARLDEQEKRVWHMRKQVIERLWCAYPSGATWQIGMANGQEGYVIASGMEQSVAEYIQAFARPNQVLEELEAKRRIIDRHSVAPAPPGATEATIEWAARHPYCAAHAYEHRDGTVSFPIQLDDCPELRDLAKPYDWHPDYRKEWTP